jgi:dihydrofolate synthase/folylpolyglutamate synthase
VFGDINYLMKRYDLKVTFFEFLTAMGFLHFSNEKCDVVVLETGLGGRFDSTNIINPLLSVITSIGHDHTETLGRTLEEIAYQKAGIIKPKVPVLLGPECQPVDVFYQEA